MRAKFNLDSAVAVAGSREVVDPQCERKTLGSPSCNCSAVGWLSKIFVMGQAVLPDEMTSNFRI